MAFCLLGMMATEACFATWVGRQRWLHETHLLKWLIGLRELPQGDPRRRCSGISEFNSCPQGSQGDRHDRRGRGVRLIGNLVALSKRRRSKPRCRSSTDAGIAAALGSARVHVGVMLCELVLVIDRRERIPSSLIVLVDTSESMGLLDPYATTASARWSSLPKVCTFS